LTYQSILNLARLAEASGRDSLTAFADVRVEELPLAGSVLEVGGDVRGYVLITVFPAVVESHGQGLSAKVVTMVCDVGATGGRLPRFGAFMMFWQGWEFSEHGDFSL
jgi:hypothetical protein